MKKLKPITLPELVKELGGGVIHRALGVDQSLPTKWKHGVIPNRKNEAKLVQLAEANGYALTLGGAK